MSLPFLPYTRQSIHNSDIQAVAFSLTGDIITRGDHVKAFEKGIADYCKAEYAVAFSSGTAALAAAYFAADLSASDRVVTSPNTFIATGCSPIQLGIFPHFVDIDRQTGCLDLNLIGPALDFKSTRGKLIVCPVHFAGIAMDMMKLSKMLYSHPDAMVIEDAAHALGSSYPTGEKVGSCKWSDMTIFSFHPAKTITTGEGGMVTTNDINLYRKLQLYRNNGIERDAPFLEKEPAPGYYEVQAITGNFHLTDMQGALGLSQLSRLAGFIKQRKNLVKLYRKLLENVAGVRLLTEEYDSHTAFHLCVVQIDFSHYGKTREGVMRDLHDRGIGTQVHYIPLYRHPVLRHKKEEMTDFFPATEAYYSEALSLPLYYELTDSDVRRVCSALKACLTRKLK
jgi:UDP-4-amino-4,6-dideoxy-L-N-acetyl-beta-L-altrosamine transaminase